MSVTRIFKIIDPRPQTADIIDNRDYSGIGNLYGNYSWLNRLINGSSQRIQRYREYDVMDSDLDVSRALDIVAEEMTGNNPKTEMPLLIKLTVDGGVQVSTKISATLNAALKTWCNIQDWGNRIYNINRQVIKYGDCFFIRPKGKNKKLIYTGIRNVVGATVSETDITDIKGWHIKVDSKAFDANMGSYINSGNIGDYNIHPHLSDDVVRFTLNDDMSDEAPFGKSILSSVYRTFKQKELLENALIIHRITRAPEKRVFYIDVGNIHPAKVAQHLESIKNEIKQKKIPTQNGGQNSVESVYDPQSINEDFFFAQYKEGKGSKVETLAGSANLGSLEDLDYFYHKLWRGLRIPQSYIDNTSEGGTTANDGKVGIAYMQEIKFSLYIERLQSNIENVMDKEFKKFLRNNNIIVDETIFKVVLPQPSNYSVSRQQSMDNDLVQTYLNTDGIEHLSKRFALKKYLQLTDQEMALNERMRREELGLNPDGDYRDLPKLYQPEAAEAGGFEGGFGNFSKSSGARSNDGNLDLGDLEGNDEADDTDVEESDEGDLDLNQEDEAKQ